MGCLTQREGEDDPMGPGPISPSCNDRCVLPLNSRTVHTWTCFQINSLPLEIPEANRPEKTGSLSDSNLLPNLGA